MKNQKYFFFSRTITPDSKHQFPKTLHLIIENEEGVKRELSILLVNDKNGSMGWSLWQHGLNHTYGHKSLDGGNRINEVNTLWANGCLPIAVIEKFLHTHSSQIDILFTPPATSTNFPPEEEEKKTIEEVDAEVEARWVDDRAEVEYYSDMSEGAWIQRQIDLQ